MNVRNFLCCMPLIWGVVITGLVFGAVDFALGSIGWKMLIQDEYPVWLVEFFRKMDIRNCVTGCSTVLYLLAMDHFLLTYGAFTVVISGALCTVEDFVIMSQCAHNKAIHLAAEGTVSVTDTSQIRQQKAKIVEVEIVCGTDATVLWDILENITIYGYTDYLNNKFKIALYAKETQRYLCFNDNWRLVGMRELRETCYFKEALVHGYFVFSSLVDEKQRVGFTRRGKPVGPKKSLNDACYMFNKIDADEFFRHHRLPEKMVNISSSSSNSRKPPRNNKNNRHKSNNQNQKLQQQQEHHGHNNNNNNNVILNNSSTSLSSTNKKQLAINRQQQQRQHQVRHHHNDPSLLLRRQQHEMKQKRRKQQKQQHQQQQQQHEQQQQRVTASPTKRLTATATATVAVTSPTATKVSATTLSSKRKGRRRKGKAKLKQQQQLLATAATSPYTDDTLYSSSSSSFSSTGFEDPDNSSSSSSLDPWSTWSTIDSFSSSSTTTTSDDSISSSSNYDAWATFISNQELEASSSSSSTTPEMMSGNDTELLQYEPELVEDADFVTDSDSDSEAAASTTYETKATSAIAATAATTTSTTGSQLVLEQTPLARSNATVRSSSITRATSAATPTATTMGETETAPSSSSSLGNSRKNPGENEVKPRTFLWTTRATAMQQPAPGSTAATSWTSSTPPQHVAPSLFSVDKNINSNLQNNTLTEASPTTATTGATGGVTMTAATTLRKPQRMFTRRLMATPFHRLAYVRNAGGDVDIDNLDNISVFPVEYDGDLDGIGGSGGNSSDGGFTGFLATSTTSKLTEPIRIGMKKIRQKGTLPGLGHRRNA